MQNGDLWRKSLRTNKIKISNEYSRPGINLELLEGASSFAISNVTKEPILS